MENFELFMTAIKKVAPVPIRFDEIEGGAKGYYHTVNKEIVIQKDMSEAQTMKTAVHECAHSLLHDKDLPDAQGVVKDAMTKEVEAESVAYAVCQYFGLDTSDYSFPYIVGWSHSHDIKDVKESLDTVRKTVGKFIDDVSEQMKVLLQERETGTITFYVAECSEFPVLGEYHENLTLDEALKAYDNIPSDRMNGVKCIGFDLQDGSEYAGKFDLVIGNVVQKELIDSIDHFRAQPLAQEALKNVEKHMAARQKDVDKTQIRFAEEDKFPDLVRKESEKAQKRKEAICI